MTTMGLESTATHTDDHTEEMLQVTNGNGGITALTPSASFSRGPKLGTQSTAPPDAVSTQASLGPEGAGDATK